MTTPGPSAEEIKVFILKGRDSTCGECKEGLGEGRWVMLAGEKGTVCLACADLDHLEFLPPGSAALTRRARKAHIRHRETRYDTLLAQGRDRWDAREEVEADVRRVLRAWEGGT